jgi:photosystem II stability/assembly factor-like uncharacterized protein
LSTINIPGLISRYPGKIQFGKSVQAGVFDEGAVRAAMAEFMDGPQSRVTVKTQKGPSDHSTEVAIVMAAKSLDQITSGVAWDLRILSFDDETDLARLAEFAKDIRVSNHSYNKKAGWLYETDEFGNIRYYEWFGGVNEAEDAKFGKYGAEPRQLDGILHANPRLISVVAAGNELCYVPRSQPVEHWAWMPPDAGPGQGHWEKSTRKRMPARKPDQSIDGGFDTITGLGVSKNAICVGAIEQLVAPTQPQAIADFSSWGPTDDGRIKPDLVAPGKTVYVKDSNGVLKAVDGTSFAAPIVAGLSALLIEFFEKSFNRPPTSAEIKALLIHSARHQGTPAPDPKFGWGLVDAVGAADVIAGAEDAGRRFFYGEIREGETNPYTYVRPDGRSRRIRVTLVWTDPPAPENKGPLNDPTPALRNDLDVELEAPDGTVFYPYSLDRRNPLNAATITGPNRVDNVEVIDAYRREVEDADSQWGEWKVRVRANRLGDGTSQKFALIVSSVSNLPNEDLLISRSHLKIRRRFIVRQDVPAPPDLAALRPRPWRWTWLGPRNLGGPTPAIVVHPTNPSILWAGSVGGGIWKTLDGGASWAPLDDFMASLSVASLVLDPTDPNILYAGTGGGDYSLDRSPGAGIFQSRDGGATWTQLLATAGRAYRYVNRVAVSRDGRTLLAAVRNRDSTAQGIARSTDRGATFSDVPSVSGTEILDVAFDPTDATKAVAGGRDGKAFFSTDGGATWAAASGLPGISGFGGRVELVYAAANAGIVYASVDNNSGELYRSNDGGRTYTLQNTGTNYLGNQGWYANTVWAGDPTDPNLVVVGGLDLYRSTDGGKRLDQISTWWKAPASPHANHYAIVAHPGYDGTTNRVVYFGNDGGIYQSTDIRASTDTTGWQSLNNNYGVTQFQSVAGNPSTGRIVGGTHGHGTVRYTPPPGPNTGPGGYTIMFGGRGGFCAADPSDPNFFYGEYLFLQLFRSTNGGASANFIYEGIPDANNYYKTNFIAPFILDPNDPNTLLAGGSRLWRSSNVRAATPTWAGIKFEADTPISAIAVARTDSNVIWVGHNDGQIYKTTDGRKRSPTWLRVDQGGARLPGRPCTRIVIDRTNPDIVYVTFGGYAADNTWKTTDGGTSFKAIANSLPPAPVYTLAIHPDNSRLLYLGNEYGVFASEDGGATWSPTNRGPAVCSVRELFWMNKTLVAATFGRGLFALDLSQVGK